MTSISLPGASGRCFVRSVFTCWACVAVANPKVKINTERMSFFMLCIASVLSVMRCDIRWRGPKIKRDLLATPFQYLFVVYCSVEKLMHQRPNPIHFFFQREMARVEKMELCTGNISFKEFSTLHRKDSIVFAPSDQRGGLLFTEILLPIGIGIQIPFCVGEDFKLNILVPRSVLISLVDHPIVRADLRRIADTMQIMPLGSFNRQKPVE